LQERVLALVPQREFIKYEYDGNSKLCLRKDAEIIYNAFPDIKEFRHSLLDVYGDGNCLIYLLYIMMKNMKIEVSDDYQEFVPHIRKELFDYFSFEITDDFKTRYFYEFNEENDFLLKEARYSPDDEMWLKMVTRFEQKVIEEELEKLWKKDYEYIISSPKNDEEYLSDKEMKGRTFDSLFVVKIFAMKYGIEIPLLLIYPIDNEVQKPNKYIMLIFGKDGKDPEITSVDPYRIESYLMRGFNYFFVNYPARIPVEIDGIPGYGIGSTHLKLLLVENKNHAGSYTFKRKKEEKVKSKKIE